LKEVVFNPVGFGVAELSIPDGPNDFGLRSSGKLGPTHDFGVYGAPRWRIRQQMSPDDAWEIETLPDGRLLPAHRSVPEHLEWAYLTWAEGSRAESGVSVLQSLPPGDYLLVRSSLESRRPASVLLGNERVPNPPANMLLLLDEEPFYGMVLGPESDNPPQTSHPLVGLVALNYIGSSRLHAALFFDCLAREARHESGASPPPASSGDLVLVVPVTGELVIDAMAAYSTKEDVMRDKDDWRRRLASRLAGALSA